MKTIKILCILMLFFLKLSIAQTDSSVVYVDGVARWKTTYDGFQTYFYNIDSLTGVRTLCAKWDDSELGRLHYRIDTITQELRLEYKDIWVDGNRYAYLVDSAGVEDLNTITYYYGSTPSNASHEISGTNVDVKQHNGKITVSATLPIVDIRVYDLEGSLLFTAQPFKKKISFDMGHGQIIIRVVTEVDIYTRKIFVD